MKKPLLIMAMMVAGQGTSLAADNAKDMTEVRSHTGFDHIVIEDTSASLEIQVGKEFSVTLEGSEKWIKRTTTSVTKGSLVIGPVDKKKKTINYKSNHLIVITMPAFTGLDVNGAVEADIAGVESDELSFELNGAGHIEVRGTCGRLNVALNGAGNFEGGRLKCEDVTAQINGAGNIEAYGSKSADVEINGVGNIDIYGQPSKVTEEKSWFSNITIHDK